LVLIKKTEQRVEIEGLISQAEDNGNQQSHVDARMR